MASEAAPQKLLYHTLNKPASTGIFFSQGTVLKCVSRAPAPDRSASKCFGPTVKQMLKPTALHKEKRPPTQSFMGKMFSAAIPKALICSILVDTATKCFATASTPN